MYGYTVAYRLKGGAQVVWQVWPVRYQGELLGLWDPQNRDLYVDRRRKLPPETKFLGGLLSPPSGVGVLISGRNIFTTYVHIL